MEATRSPSLVQAHENHRGGVCDQAATHAMFRALEQHFGLATRRLLCFDLITGRGEPHIQFIFPGRRRNVIRVAARFAAGVNRRTLTRLAAV